MTYKSCNFLNKFIRDKDGKIVIWQSPNVPLWGWIICSLLALVVSKGRMNSGFHNLLAQAFLFVWAYLELRAGESIFRRVLGVVVFLTIVSSYF